MMLLLYVTLAIFGFCMLYRIPLVKYYVKFLIFAAMVSVGSVFYVVYFVFVGRSYKNAWRFKRLFWLSGRIIGLKAIVRNPEYLHPEKPCIFVSNHQSIIDVFSLCGVWPEHCTVVSKSSLKFAGPMGLVTWFSKLIFIDRSKHKDAVSIMKKAAEEASRDQVSVLVFAEGTRSNLDTLLPFKKGAFHLAVDCQFPIQPIVISSYNKFLDHDNKRFDDATYYVEVLPQISTTGKTDDDVDQLLKQTRDKMLECFEKLKTLPLPS
ncbi:1-acyl-sn-glycerol-3-phosphate acyltransferase [Fasciola hepatica]|uniref:1-acyl-sn-glycerol-3-phosphate acyltransferase n=1 Tax=Fasciola hepatica TaxID=6192 RepID=A0A2H1CT09_FASHE|nr:1-acyl-sn-glycerol-3-phosphate acyltransferase [Fasciola hepatica]